MLRDVDEVSRPKVLGMSMHSSDVLWLYRLCYSGSHRCDRKVYSCSVQACVWCAVNSRELLEKLSKFHEFRDLVVRGIERGILLGFYHAE